MLVGARGAGGLGAVTVGLGGVVAVDDDEVLRTVVVLAREVGLEDGLGAVGVALLGVEGLGWECQYAAGDWKMRKMGRASRLTVPDM